MEQESEVIPESAQLPKWRRAVIFVVCCNLLLVALGSDWSNAIPYAELILEPCTSGAEHGTPGERFNGSNNESTHTIPMNSTFPTFPTNSTPNSTSPPGTIRDNCGGFGLGSGRTAWVASTYSCIRAGTAWVAGVVVDIFGVRRAAIIGLALFAFGNVAGSFSNRLFILYITNGLIAGVGGGLLFGIPIPVVDKVATRGKSFLVAFVTASSGLGATFLALVAKPTIDYGGWRWYYRMLALVAVGTVLSTLAFPSQLSKQRGNQKPSSARQGSLLLDDNEIDADKETDSEHQPSHSTVSSPTSSTIVLFFRKVVSSFRLGFSLYRNFNFLMMIIVLATQGFALYFPILTIKQRARTLSDVNLGDSDVNLGDSFFQVELVGIGGFAGGLTLGLAIQFSKLPPILVQGLTFISLGVASALSTFVTSTLGLRCFITAYAFLVMAQAALTGLVALQVVRPDQKQHAVGQLVAWSSITLAIGPPIGGWMLEASGSFTLPVLVAGAILCLAGTIELVLHIRVWHAKRRSFELLSDSSTEQIEMESITEHSS